MKIVKSFLFLSFLALQPFVDFILSNYHSYNFSIMRALVFLLACIGILGLFQIIASFFSKKYWFSASIIGLSYITLFNLYIGDAYRFRYTLLSLCAAIPAIFFLSWMIEKSKPFRKGFIFIFSALLLANGMSIFFKSNNVTHKNTLDNEQTYSDIIQKIPPRLKGPNVYFILPDGYMGADAYEAHFHHPLQLFVDLSKKGFHINKHAYSNAHHTVISLPTIYAMNEQIEVNHPISFERVLEINRIYALGENPVIDEFKARGYKYIRFTDGVGSECDGKEDWCFSHEGLIKMQELAFLERAKFSFLLGYLDSKFHFLNRYKGAMGFSDFIPYLPSLNDSPFFVSIHLALPHPPYRFNAACEKTFEPTAASDNPELYRNMDYKTHLDLYNSQMKCVDKQISELSDAILVRDPSALILVQSDHAARILFRAEKPMNEYSEKDYLDLFNMFSAFKVPPYCEQYLKDDFSAVNTFRFVFGCLDHTTPVYLEHPHALIYRAPGEPIDEWVRKSNHT